MLSVTKLEFHFPVIRLTCPLCVGTILQFMVSLDMTSVRDATGAPSRFSSLDQSHLFPSYYEKCVWLDRTHLAREVMPLLPGVRKRGKEPIASDSLTQDIKNPPFVSGWDQFYGATFAQSFL